MKTSLLVAAGLAASIFATQAVAQRAEHPKIEYFNTLPTVVNNNFTSVQNTRALDGRENVHLTNPGKLPLDSKRQRSLLSLGPGDSIGYTYYDFQTNASMPDRVINWPGEGGNGGIKTSVIWMAATETATQTRGTYGAVSDGTQWIPIDFSSWSKVEPSNLRTGFCEIAKLSTGELAIINHTASTSSLTDGNPNLLKENGAGSGTFQVIPLTGAEGGLWPRLAVGGNDAIHVIYTYQTGTANDGVLMYQRSTDKGATWTTPTPLTGPSSVVLANLREVQGGDAYAMDANGDNVVIWYYSRSVQILQLKSTDGGETWTPALVLDPQYQHEYFSADDDHQLRPDDTFGADTVGFRSDTAIAPGSSMDVMIEADGRVRGVHAFFPAYIRRFYLAGGDTTTASGIIYKTSFNYTDAGLMYFEEQDGQGFRTLLTQPGNLTNQFSNLDERSYNSGFSRWPQLGKSSDGRLFLTFSSGTSDDFITAKSQLESTQKNYLFSHIWGMYTMDGRDWSAPLNMTPNGVDCQWPSLADYVDGELTIAYGADTYPGDWLTSSGTNTTSGAPTGSGLHEQLRNNVEVMSIQEQALGPIIGSGVATEEKASAVSASRIVAVAPNPAIGTAQITYRVSSSGDYTLKLYNTLGQEVSTLLENVNRLAGSYTLSVDVTNIQPGSYVLVLNGKGGSSAMSLNIVR